MFSGKVNGKSLYATKHVLERGAKRGVSLDQIKKVLANPHVQYETKAGSIHFESTVDGKRIVVILEDNNKKFILITCWKR